MESESPSEGGSIKADTGTRKAVATTMVAEQAVPLAAPLRGQLRGRARDGIRPGLLGGVVMAVVLGILAIGRGVPFFNPMMVISSVLLGQGATGAAPVLLGTTLHLLVSALLGMVFVSLVGSAARTRMLAFGALYGIVCWIFSQFAVLPLFGSELAARLGTVWTFFLGHLSYGLMLAASAPTRKDIDDTERRNLGIESAVLPVAKSG